MIQIRMFRDLETIETLWRRHWPRRVISDLWPVRACFQAEYNRPPRVLAAFTREGQFRGMLALSWMDEVRCFGHFPGEVWQNKTWLEQNRIIAAEPEVARALLDHVPEGALHLRYLVPDPALPAGAAAEIDEIDYLFHPARYGCAFPDFMRLFSGRSRKKIRRELEPLHKQGVSIRQNRFEDVARLFDLNLSAFGEMSYFNDARFLHAFENLAAWLDAARMLRVTTVVVGGRIAAVDMSALYNGVCTVLAGGVDPDFPGVAKLINLHHLEWACSQGLSEMDFLCGDFNWKERFHLTPRPLFRIRRQEAVEPYPVPEARAVACAG